MADSITIRKTYKYRLYRCDRRDQYLHRQINVAGRVWNHALALQKRYYRLAGKYISLYMMQPHIANLRMKTERYAFWKQLGSQAVQDICKRLDDAYLRFFQHIAKRPPKFKTAKRYPSFTLKQAGYKLLDGNKVEISQRTYKFVKHRPIPGTVKTLTVKRDACNRLWLIFSVIEKVPAPNEPATGETAGFDFGLKTFLTDHSGKAYLSPLFYKHELKRIRRLQKRKDKKPHGTNNRRKATRLLSRTHIRIADKRRDYHFQLANDLCDQFDVLIFEDLNLDGMKRLWGCKVSDLGFYQFVSVLQHIANKRGKQVIFIDRFERTFCCGSCGLVIDRDHNAAINILRAGTSAHTGLEVVSRWATDAALLEARSPRL